jgi:hypothetical protein
MATDEGKIVSCVNEGGGGGRGKVRSIFILYTKVCVSGQQRKDPECPLNTRLHGAQSRSWCVDEKTLPGIELRLSSLIYIG